MLRYITARFLLVPITLIVTVTIVFFLTRVVPGSAVAVILGPHATSERVAEVTARYGLDRPIIIQYYYYLRNLFRGDLGRSVMTHRPVAHELLEYLPASVELVAFSMLLIVILGVGLGVASAVYKNSVVDAFARGIAVLGVSLPQFWLGLMLLLALSFSLHIFPSGGRLSPSISPPQRITGCIILDGLMTGNWRAVVSALHHLLLPALTLGITNISATVRLVRDGMLKVLKEDYVLAALSYGMPKKRVYFKYALKNAILPALTNLGMTCAYLFAGAFLVEYIFRIPGIGYYATNALIFQDYAPIAGCILLVSGLYAFLNLFIDILYAIIDPRIRF